MDELKEMRSQLASMKQTLRNVELVNKGLLKRIISQKASSFNKIFLLECLSYPLLILALLGIAVGMHVNLWVVWVFLIGSSISLIFDYKYLRIPSKDLAVKSMMEIKADLIKQKKGRMVQNTIELPLSIAWMIWFFLEAFHPFSLSGNLRLFLLIFLVLMVVFTIFLVLFLLKKIEASADSIIEELDPDGDNE